MSDRLAQLQKLFEADPRDPFVTYGIAMEHIKADDLDTARQWLDRTIDIDPKYAYAFFFKGKVLADMGEDDQAREALQAGLSAARDVGDDKAYSEISEMLTQFS